MTTPDTLAAQLADITVSERYRLLGIAERAVQEAGIMLADQDTAIDVIDNNIFTHEPLERARQELIEALGRNGCDVRYNDSND